MRQKGSLYPAPNPSTPILPSSLLSGDGEGDGSFCSSPYTFGLNPSPDDDGDDDDDDDDEDDDDGVSEEEEDSEEESREGAPLPKRMEAL